MLLDVRDLSIRFGGIQAVAEFGLEVKEGEIVGLIGPNGSGKSTVLNCLTGIYRPNRGSVRFRGVELLGLPPSTVAKHGVSRTFQNLQLFPELTVIENVLIGMHTHLKISLIPQILKLPRAARVEAEARDRAHRLLEEFGIPRLSGWRVGELPYGQQKIVELARALAMTPTLLLLDEPVGGLSQEERFKIGELIEMIRAERGLTTVLIEHDMGFVGGVCDRVVVMNFGRNIAMGTPAEIQADAHVQNVYLGEARHA